MIGVGDDFWSEREGMTGMKWMTALLLVLGSTSVAHAQLAERSFRYDLALDIDTQGRVVRVTLPDGVPAPFVAPLEKAASGSAVGR